MMSDRPRTLVIYVGAMPDQITEAHVLVRRADVEPSPEEIRALLEETGLSDFVIRRTTPVGESARALPVDAVRERPLATMSPAAVMVVATREVVSDLGRLIPTVLAFTGLPIHVVGDAEACRFAAGVGQFFGQEERVIVHPWITPESAELAELESARVVKHASYWKVLPIWWKLQGLIDLFPIVGGPILLLDSDIVLTREDCWTWLHVDVVLSPFYWPGDVPLVPRAPGDLSRWPLPSVHGEYNAGMLLAGRVEVAEEWMRLYQAGVGGFYEQGCLGHLTHRFEHDVFSTAHNWGIWRKHGPRAGCGSVHRHAETPVKCAASRAIEAAAMGAVEKAYRRLGKGLV